MAVTVKIAGQVAILSDRRWRSKDRGLAKVLNGAHLPRQGWDPDPDHTAAREAVERLGGEILCADPPPLSDPNFVY